MTLEQVRAHLRNIQPFVRSALQCTVIKIEAVDIYVGLHPYSIDRNAEAATSAASRPATEATGVIEPW